LLLRVLAIALRNLIIPQETLRFKKSFQKSHEKDLYFFNKFQTIEVGDLRKAIPKIGENNFPKTSYPEVQCMCKGGGRHFRGVKAKRSKLKRWSYGEVQSIIREV
jgi:hypothetical protein